jgi:hypothetical protein
MHALLTYHRYSRLATGSIWNLKSMTTYESYKRCHIGCFWGVARGRAHIPAPTRQFEPSPILVTTNRWSRIGTNRRVCS